MPRELYHAVVATTHLDRHGARFTKENLEEMVARFESTPPSLITWEHEETLLPLGIVTKAFVEAREDGEYQLVNEWVRFDDGDFVNLTDTDYVSLTFTSEQIQNIVDNIPITTSGYLTINYDPQNFDESDLSLELSDLDTLIPTRIGKRIRKGQSPETILWIIVGFALMNFATGFFSQLGKDAAQKVSVKSRDFYQQLGPKLYRLLRKAKYNEQPSTVIFGIPIPDSTEIVIGAVENADSQTLAEASSRIPELYALAVNLIEANRPNYFKTIRFLFNPSTREWEVNYLMTSKDQIIRGPRYHDEKHPLREKYENMLQHTENLDTIELGASVSISLASDANSIQDNK